MDINARMRQWLISDMVIGRSFIYSEHVLQEVEAEGSLAL